MASSGATVEATEITCPIALIQAFLRFWRQAVSALDGPPQSRKLIGFNKFCPIV
jgi:hypothetical protein